MCTYTSYYNIIWILVQNTILGIVEFNHVHLYLVMYANYNNNSI